ncbi:hypothetical protein EDD11_008565 [Mortierella claussenii]|nr:hypothetical protein EDD11_008565 [Mortierella claussenii]
MVRGGAFQDIVYGKLRPKEPILQAFWRRRRVSGVGMDNAIKVKHNRFVRGSLDGVDDEHAFLDVISNCPNVLIGHYGLPRIDLM